MEAPNDLYIYQILSVLSLIITIVGAAATIVINLSKARPEAKKISSEGDSAIANAADSIANGAKISSELLLQRLEEMELREKARDTREEQLQAQLEAVQASLADWQDWARRLVHQLKSHGYEPVPFKVAPKTGPLSEPK
jgi:hypothetical protein